MSRSFVVAARTAVRTASSTGTQSSVKRFFGGEEEKGGEEKRRRVGKGKGGSMGKGKGKGKAKGKGNAHTAARHVHAEGDKVLSILTYNICFDEIDEEKRMAALAREIERANADVVALQEVTPRLHEILLRQPWADTYARRTSAPPDNAPYYTLIFTRLEYVDRGGMLRMGFRNSVMGRDVLLGRLRVPAAKGLEITVGTTHLESTKDYAGSRREQLEKMLKAGSRAVQGTSDAFLVGDMNLRKEEGIDLFTSEAHAADKWIDAWLEMPGETHASGFTFVKTEPFAWSARFDRVFARLHNLAIRSMRVIKNSTASDHYGLYVDFALSEDSPLREPAPEDAQ